MGSTNSTTWLNLTFYFHNLYDVLESILCPLNTYSSSGYSDTADCEPCPSGTHTTEVGATACVPGKCITLMEI